MNKKILLGQDRQIIEFSQTVWEQHLTQIPLHSQTRLNFMTDAHHQIRYFVVRELVNRQKPIEPEFISEKLKIPLDRVNDILEELEHKLFFLLLNKQGA